LGSDLKRTLIALLLIFCCGKPLLHAAPASMSLDQLLVQMAQQDAQRASSLRVYECTRKYRLAYSGFFGSRSAEMVVKVRYQAPDTQEFVIVSESGSEILRNRVLHKIIEAEKEAFRPENRVKTALNASNYHFAVTGFETAGAGPSYVLSAEPITPSKFLFRGRVWVDADSFAVERVEAEPAKNPSFWIKQNLIKETYSPVNHIWLPTQMSTLSNIKLGGRAEMTVDYSEYKVDAGGKQLSSLAVDRIAK
jgi:hypothetical protein